MEINSGIHLPPKKNLSSALVYSRCGLLLVLLFWFWSKEFGLVYIIKQQ